MYVVSNRLTQVEVLRERFEHAFQRLADEIHAYPNDWKIWIREGEIRDSAGNLSLLLIQLVHHTAMLLTGKEQPSADQEHSGFMSRAELVKKAEKARKSLMESISNIREDALDREFPLPFQNKPITASTYLIYLLTEIYFHLGRINYHRKLV